MSLLKVAGLMKTVTKTRRCFDKLVKEFIVNVGPEVGQPGHEDHFKGFVRGCCVQLSPAEINRYLGRGEAAVEEEEEVSLEDIVKEVTARQLEEWPAKGIIPSS